MESQRDQNSMLQQREEALAWYANQVRVLYAINRAILEAQSPQAIAEATLRGVRRLIRCQYAHVAMLPTDETRAVVLASDADAGLGLEPICWPVEALSVWLESVPPKQVVTMLIGEGAVVPSMYQPLSQIGMRLIVNAPLLAHDTLIGELLLASAEPEMMDATDLDIIRQVADQLAVAMRHAQLFEEVQHGREQLQGLSHRLIEVQEAERRTIAGELHDEIGQALTLVTLNLQAVQRLAGAATEVGAHLGESIAIVDRAMEQVRNLSLDLRPSLLDDLGLVAALRWYVARQSRWAGFTLHMGVKELDRRLAPALETACFRVAQEAITNVVRHSRATEVWVQLHHNDELCLTIRDNGIGFNVAAAQARAAHGGSFGLLGMRERVGLVGGRLAITSSPEQGTTVSACFPVRELPPAPDDEERSWPI